MPVSAGWNDIDPFVMELERRFAQGGAVKVSEVLPPSTHPYYSKILVELLRVDLELCWSNGIERTIDDYIDEFDVVRNSPALIQLIAFEEYRARRQNGLDPSPDYFRLRFNIDTSTWPTGKEELPSHLRSGTVDDRVSSSTVEIQSNPSHSRESAISAVSSELLDSLPGIDRATSQRLGEALSLLENDFTTFQGYQLIREIGRGVFARVFLARQPNFSGRYVVLKIAADLRGEPQTLSRLQHTNIVPIYSVHDAGPLQAFIMPFFWNYYFCRYNKRIEENEAVSQIGRMDC